MATFAATVERLTIEDHHNADALELAVVGNYRAIVRKGQFQTGDLGVYIPEQSLVPDWLIKVLGLEGRLAGKQQNRVKAIKLRGILSQGLVVPLPRRLELAWVELSSTSPDHGFLRVPVPEGFANDVTMHDDGVDYEFVEVTLGEDVTEMLGIKKWEPEIPASMSGEVYNPHFQFKYDIENVKRYPTILHDGMPVVMTEKIHGTLCMLAHLPEGEWSDEHLNGKWVVSSKGLAAQGIALRPTEDNLAKNTYFRALLENGVLEAFEKHIGRDEKVVMLGEVFGRGVQDLRYGNETSKFGFRVFDVAVWQGGDFRYLSHKELTALCWQTGMPEMVPILYEGPFSQEVLEEHTNGRETVSGMESHVREGVVIRPRDCEQYDSELGRVILKSVSEAYLLRKGGTEYN